MAAIDGPGAGTGDRCYKALFSVLCHPAFGRQGPLDFGLATTAVIGTSAIPWPSAAFAQRTMRSIEAPRLKTPHEQGGGYQCLVRNGDFRRYCVRAERSDHPRRGPCRIGLKANNPSR